MKVKEFLCRLKTSSGNISEAILIRDSLYIAIRLSREDIILEDFYGWENLEITAFDFKNGTLYLWTD